VFILTLKHLHFQANKTGIVKSSHYLTLLIEIKLKRFVVTYPSVVMVTIVYQKAAGMDVKFVPSTFFSA
jgi:hypothetical protein